MNWGIDAAGLRIIAPNSEQLQFRIDKNLDNNIFRFVNLIIRDAYLCGEIIINQTNLL